MTDLESKAVIELANKAEKAQLECESMREAGYKLLLEKRQIAKECASLEITIEELKTDRAHWFKRAMHYKHKMEHAQCIAIFTTALLVSGIVFQWFAHNF